MAADATRRGGTPGSPPSAPARPGSNRVAGRRGAIQPEHIYKAVGLFFLLLVVYRFFSEITRVLLIAYAAAILAIALNVVVGLFPSHRRLASAALGVLIMGLAGVALWFAIPALAEQLRGLIDEIPRLEAMFAQATEWLRIRTGLDVELWGGRTVAFLGRALAEAEVLGTAVSLLEGIFIPLVILFGGLYAVAKPNERLLSPMLQAIPRERRNSFRRLLELLGARLKGWVKGTLVGMLAVGTLTTLGLYALGVEYALLLGVISGLFEIVPIVGPWISGLIVVAVALLDDPTTALWVALLMLVIQQLESNVITPFVMSAVAEVHPFITLFALFLFGSIFGFLGVILALPLVLLVWTVLEVLWVERAIDTDRDFIDPVVRE